MDNGRTRESFFNCMDKRSCRTQFSGEQNPSIFALPFNNRHAQQSPLQAFGHRRRMETGLSFTVQFKGHASNKQADT